VASSSKKQKHSLIGPTYRIPTVLILTLTRLCGVTGATRRPNLLVWYSMSKYRLTISFDVIVEADSGSDVYVEVDVPLRDVVAQFIDHDLDYPVEHTHSTITLVE
jgi:hypothetical protein